MRALLDIASPGARALSYLLGFTVIGLASAVMITETQITDIVAWSERIFGSLFLIVICGLVFVAALALVKVSGRAVSAPGVRTWFEAGIQAANAIAKPAANLPSAAEFGAQGPPAVVSQGGCTRACE